MNINDHFISMGAPPDVSAVDEDKLIHNYKKKMSEKVNRIDKIRQKKFGAEYLITSNALTEQDNNILVKHAGITLCTN